MLVVMAMTLAMFLMCSAVLAMGKNARLIAVFEVNQDKAYYIAEAGIEKVLADAKNGPAWLKNLNVGEEYDFLSNVLNFEINYGEGAFEHILVKKLTEGARQTSLEIDCRAKCGSSIKRVRVNADLETACAENLFRGLWLADGSSPGGHVFNLQTDVYFSGGDAIINSGSDINGDIYSVGKVCLRCDGGAIKINGDIYTLGGVCFTGPGEFSINGVIYVDDINKVPDEVKDITTVLPAGQLAARIPGVSGFPSPLSAERLGWYEKNAGYKQLPPVDNDTMVFQNGIYFLSGDCTLSGTYRGCALIVVDGDVALGRLVRESGDDSLAVLAAGPVCCAPGSEVIEALVYSSTYVDSSSLVPVKGSVSAAGLAGQEGPVIVSYDGDMFNVFRDVCNWTTCFVRISRWSE